MSNTLAKEKIQKTPIENLKKSIEKGDYLALNSLHFFENTTWGKEFSEGKKTFDHAVECISLDVLDGYYFPAKSIKQAHLFIKRLSVAAQK